IVVYRLVSFLLMATIGWIVFAARFRGAQQQGEEGPDPAPLWRRRK
ncbi:TIGR00374 family protein, partial [Rhodococcus opacus]|nr:TIGR00374 family protein [Rhodococcus opacus]